MGGKLIAVPFKALSLKYDADKKSWTVYIDVKKEQLDKAPGFPTDKWPDYGDRLWLSNVDGTPAASSKALAAEKE